MSNLEKAIYAGEVSQRVRHTNPLWDKSLNYRNEYIQRHAEQNNLAWEEAWQDYQAELRKVVNKIP